MTSPVAGAHPRVRIVTTKGNVYVTLFPEWAPLTVANFLGLARAGYYAANRWFRIVPDFVVQTGDPHDDGNGDAGYSLGAEENPLEQRSYVISMGLNYDDKTQTPIQTRRERSTTSRCRRSTISIETSRSLAKLRAASTFSRT